MIPSVQEFDIELLWDGVHAWDLVVPCAVANYKAIAVCLVLFMNHETNSLYEGALNLRKQIKDVLNR
jgi:hypothetical protein